MKRLLLFITLLCINGIATAEITWLWKFNTEFGIILTDGNVTETSGAASFNILSFQVKGSQFPPNIGANYIEFQPVQGFLWNGDEPVEFFRSSGGFTNGSNFFHEGTAFFYGLNPPPLLSQLNESAFNGGLPLEGLLLLKVDTVFNNQFE